MYWGILKPSFCKKFPARTSNFLIFNFNCTKKKNVLPTLKAPPNTLNQMYPRLLLTNLKATLLRKKRKSTKLSKMKLLFFLWLRWIFACINSRLGNVYYFELSLPECTMNVKFIHVNCFEKSFLMYNALSIPLVRLLTGTAFFVMKLLILLYLMGTLALLYQNLQV